MKTICLMRLILSLYFVTFPSAFVGGSHDSPESPARAQGAADTLRLPGLRALVNVRRDERGIPYIEAANEEDLMFAQGYITATDRLWQMELLRRTARGELAELLGQDVLEEDKRHRIFGYSLAAEKSVSMLSAPLSRNLVAYARGVNAYINSCDEQSLPPEFKMLQIRPREWRVSDSIVIGRLFSERLAMSWHKDIMRATLADVPQAKRDLLMIETSPLDVLLVGNDNTRPQQAASPGGRKISLSATERSGLLASLREIELSQQRSLERVGLYAENGAVSNAWVVSGRHTASGKPLLANDPHLSPTAPSIWHMVHLSAPNLRVSGVTPPGIPNIVIGHNEQIAWGMTNLIADVQDIYLETFDPARPSQYQTPQGLREAEVRREEIKVRKDKLNPAVEVIVQEVTVTRHGPIVLESGGKRYALRWKTLDPSNIELEGFYQLNRARNRKEFCAALSRYRGPAHSFVYADVAGHIGYYAAGLIPIRKKGYGDLPYDGANDDGEWVGSVDFTQLPHVFDPPSGIIVTANNRIVGRSYPHFLTKEWVSPHRARRILDLLQAKPKLTIEDFRGIQGDIYSLSAVAFTKGVLRTAQATASEEDDEGWRETIRLFAEWDGKILDSRTVSLVWAMRQNFRERIVVNAINQERENNFRWGNFDTFTDKMITEQHVDWLPPDFKDYAQFLRACQRSARELLKKRLGADETQWTWGKLARTGFYHPLANRPQGGPQFRIPTIPEIGSGGGIGATPNSGANVSMRLIADLSDWDKSQQGITPGVSGNPASPHWKDQLEDWKAVAPRPFPFSTEAVKAAAKSVTVLRP